MKKLILALALALPFSIGAEGCNNCTTCEMAETQAIMHCNSLGKSIALFTCNEDNLGCAALWTYECYGGGLETPQYIGSCANGFEVEYEVIAGVGATLETTCLP